jgi:hypothetical protein
VIVHPDRNHLGVPFYGIGCNISGLKALSLPELTSPVYALGSRRAKRPAKKSGNELSVIVSAELPRLIVNESVFGGLPPRHIQQFRAPLPISGA